MTLARPRQASREELLRFHDAQHVDCIKARSRLGRGYLDYGSTPAFRGAFEAASSVAGSALEGLDRIFAVEARRTFQPIGLGADAAELVRGWSAFGAVLREDRPSD